MVSFKQDCINLLSRHNKDKNIPAGVLANFIESSLRNLDKVYEDCISKAKVGKTTILHGVKSVEPVLTTEELSKLGDMVLLDTDQSGELMFKKNDLPAVELKAGEELPEGDKIHVDKAVDDMNKLLNKW
jgi:NAD(P)H-flavin reductase